MRLGKAMFVLCAIIVGVSALMLFVVPWLFPLGFGNEKIGSSRPGFARQAGREDVEDGHEVIRAVYRYKHEVGLWPRDLDELVPGYLTLAQVEPWQYEWWPHGRWTLNGFGGFPVSSVRFLHSDDREVPPQWQVNYGDAQSRLRVKQTFPELPPVPPDQKETRMLREWDRRIGAYPNEIDHHKGLVTYLLQQKAFNTARRVCERTLERWPEHWWPNLAIALADLGRGEVAQGENYLKARAEKRREFNDYFLLWCFYIQADRKNAAAEAMIRGSRFPIMDSGPGLSKDTGERSSWGGVNIAMFAALAAHQEKEYTACLAVCDAWERDADTFTDRQASYLALRAACHLAQGDFDAAKQQIDRAIQRNKDNRLWVEGLEGLREAIEAKNIAFGYKPRLRLVFDVQFKYE